MWSLTTERTRGTRSHHLQRRRSFSSKFKSMTNHQEKYYWSWLWRWNAQVKLVEEVLYDPVDEIVVEECCPAGCYRCPTLQHHHHHHHHYYPHYRHHHHHQQFEILHARTCPCCIGDPESPFWQLWYKHRLQISRFEDLRHRICLQDFFPWKMCNLLSNWNQYLIVMVILFQSIKKKKKISFWNSRRLIEDKYFETVVLALILLSSFVMTLEDVWWASFLPAHKKKKISWQNFVIS